MPESNHVLDAHGRLLALFDKLAGPEHAHGAIRRLLNSDESLESIAQFIAASNAFEIMYKAARTWTAEPAGRKEADAKFIGLEAVPADTPFAEMFTQHFRPNLEHRAEGFSVIFDELANSNNRLLILETGCMRIPRNWQGDGQSTFMFDTLARATHSTFFSIDISLESVETARRACSSATHLILNDSVASLHALSRLIPSKASLLYLDSYDVDVANPLPSAIHHVMELAAAQSLIGPGTLVCVDDYGIGSEGGKGMILDSFLSNIRAVELYSGYQKIWRVV